MKRVIFLLIGVLPLVSCGTYVYEDEDPFGFITTNFNSTDFEASVSALANSFGIIPSTDTSRYHLSVVSSDGTVVYEGDYGNRPDVFEVAPGEYVLKAVSVNESMPAFAVPVLGDEQTVSVAKGEEISVSFLCRQTNCGIRLDVGEAFMDEYPTSCFYFKTGTSSIRYPYSEKRFLYFDEGEVGLYFMLDVFSPLTELFKRHVNRAEMITLVVGGEGSFQDGGGLKITVDTSRTWMTENVDLGDLTARTEALSVSEAKRNAGKENVWVCGYIVGGDLSSSSVRCEPPFKSRTNLAIADSKGEKDKDDMLSVELPSGSLRDDLNLADNPDLLGKKIYLYGTIVDSYFGITGLKKTKKYAW